MRGQKRALWGSKKRIGVYPGQYYDEETGLHYNYHRYYDPSTGRYLRPDPIGLAGGINLWIYAHLNPINAIDPLGLDTIGKGLDVMVSLLGFGGNLNVQFVKDDKGNIGLAVTKGGGGYTEVLGASASYSQGKTKADSINDLAGKSVIAGAGGTYNIGPTPIGATYTYERVFAEKYTGSYHQYGLSVSVIPIEAYGMLTETYVYNFTDMLELAFNLIFNAPLPEDNIYSKDLCE